MQQIPVPGAFLVQATFLRDGNDPVINAFAFRPRTTIIPAELPTKVREWLDGVYGTGSATTPPTWGSVLSGGLFGLYYRVYDLGDLTAGAWEIPSATFRTTAGSTTSVPPQDVAMCVSWKTDKRGPSFRGRTFLGPLAAGPVGAGGLFAQVQIDGAVQAARRFIGDPLTRTIEPCIWSRTRGVVTPITGGYIDREPDTQRRRGSKGTGRTTFIHA